MPPVTAGADTETSSPALKVAGARFPMDGDVSLCVKMTKEAVAVSPSASVTVTVVLLTVSPVPGAVPVMRPLLGPVSWSVKAELRLVAL